MRVVEEAPGEWTFGGHGPSATAGTRSGNGRAAGRRAQAVHAGHLHSRRQGSSKEYSGRVDADKVVREIGSITRPESWRRKAAASSDSSWRSRPAGRQRRRTSGRQAGILRTRRRHWTPLSQFFGVTRGVKVKPGQPGRAGGAVDETNTSQADRVKAGEQGQVASGLQKADGCPDIIKAQALARRRWRAKCWTGRPYSNRRLWDRIRNCIGWSTLRTKQQGQGTRLVSNTATGAAGYGRRPAATVTLGRPRACWDSNRRSSTKHY